MGEKIPVDSARAICKYINQHYAQHDESNDYRYQRMYLKDLVNPFVSYKSGFCQLYTSLKRCFNQWLMMLSTNVKIKSVMPAAKIVLYSMVPVGVSPRLTWTM